MATEVDCWPLGMVIFQATDEKGIKMIETVGTQKVNPVVRIACGVVGVIISAFLFTNLPAVVFPYVRSFAQWAVILFVMASPVLFWLVVAFVVCWLIKRLVLAIIREAREH